MPASDFVLGGLASMAATSVTNPLEVVKTRLQLQGELAKKGTYEKPYRGIVHAFITIAKNEGLTGLQKGLTAAICFQFIMNSMRFGIFTNAVDRGWANNQKGELSFPLGVIWGAIGGVVGTILASPFFMVKTQLQSQAAKSISVGYQHDHNGVFDALSRTYFKNGIRGLWKGSLATIPRACIGSGVQMGTYESVKKALKNYDIITDRTLNSFAASVISGTATSIAITPADLVTTRVYNQPVDSHGRGLIYKGWFDCIYQIYRAEGIAGSYKGFWANFTRMGPHAVIVLFVFDHLKMIRETFLNS